MALEHGTITANDLEFAYLADGPADGPLALCLHGFPDTAWTYTTGRLYLEILPGAGALLGGLILMGARSRHTALFGALLAIATGTTLGEIIASPWDRRVARVRRRARV